MGAKYIDSALLAFLVGLSLVESAMCGNAVSEYISNSFVLIETKNLDVQ